MGVAAGCCWLLGLSRFGRGLSICGGLPRALVVLCPRASCLRRFASVNVRAASASASLSAIAISLARRAAAASDRRATILDPRSRPSQRACLCKLFSLSQRCSRTLALRPSRAFSSSPPPSSPTSSPATTTTRLSPRLLAFLWERPPAPCATISRRHTTTTSNSSSTTVTVVRLSSLHPPPPPPPCRPRRLYRRFLPCYASTHAIESDEAPSRAAPTPQTARVPTSSYAPSPSSPPPPAPAPAPAAVAASYPGYPYVQVSVPHLLADSII